MLAKAEFVTNAESIEAAQKRPETLLDGRPREVLDCAFEAPAFDCSELPLRASPIQRRVARNVLARSPDFMLEHNPLDRNAGDFIVLLSVTGVFVIAVLTDRKFGKTTTSRKYPLVDIL